MQEVAVYKGNRNMKSLIILLFLQFKIAISIYGQHVEVITLKSSVFNNTRNIRVYLPPDYKDSEAQYPVLYLNDGIATFHAYDLADVVDSMILHRIIEPIIIVGIDNGGSTVDSRNPIRDRAHEYLPWPDLLEDSLSRDNAPAGKEYPEFLFDEVMPLVNRKYRTQTGEQNTGLGGASYGALISVYTIIHHPGKIGYALLESPSLYVHEQRILIEAKDTKEFPKTYIGIGTKEGATQDVQLMALEDSKELFETISQQVEKEKVMLLIDEKAKHTFYSFARRFSKALQFLYGIK